MTQKLTILFDLDGTLVDTAPDLMNAHNHVMKKFGYETKSTDDIRQLIGQGAGSLIGRSVWGHAKKEFSQIDDGKIKKEMVSEFIDFYGKKDVVIQSLYDDFQRYNLDTDIIKKITNKEPTQIAKKEPTQTQEVAEKEKESRIVKAKANYKHVGDISINEGCKMALEKAKLRAIEKTFGTSSRFVWGAKKRKNNRHNIKISFS